MDRPLLRSAYSISEPTRCKPGTLAQYDARYSGTSLICINDKRRGAYNLALSNAYWSPKPEQ